MKKNILLTITALFLAFSSFAQTDEDNSTQKHPVPKWVSGMGYWVIETSIKSPDKSVVSFYNNEDALVYKEKINGLVLNVKKRRIKMCLKQVLEQSVYAYEKNHNVKENEMWVMNTIRK